MRLKLPNAGDGNERMRARYTADRFLEDDLGCQARKGNESCVIVKAVVDEASGADKPVDAPKRTNDSRRICIFMWFMESNEHHSDNEHGDMDEIECFVEPPADELHGRCIDYVKCRKGNPAKNLLLFFHFGRAVSCP